MGWVKNFFKPAQGVREDYVQTQEGLMNTGVAAGDPMWITWKYIRDQPFESGPLGFYTWISAISKGVRSGEIDPEELKKLLGLGDLDGKA